jgi:hypothetical protein
VRLVSGSFHLAQCNIARLRAPLDSPMLADFVAALEPINGLADRSPGFVWRLQTEEGDATSIRAFDDDMLIVNMSLWESVDALATFTYRSDHRQVLRRRREWFELIEDASVVLWWVPAGHIPTVDEARQKLDLLQALGATRDAFTLRTTFPAPDDDSEVPVGNDRGRAT